VSEWSFVLTFQSLQKQDYSGQLIALVLTTKLIKTRENMQEQKDD